MENTEDNGINRRMRIFYADYATGVSVPSEKCIGMDYADARRILNKLRTTGSFIGAWMSETKVLQMACENGGTFHLEVLDVLARSASVAKVNLPIAEIALEAAYESKDIESALAEFLLDWSTGSYALSQPKEQKDG